MDRSSLPVAHAYWKANAPNKEYTYRPFAINGLGGMNRYYVLESGEIVLSEDRMPQGDGNEELRKGYLRQAAIVGIRTVP